MSKIKRIAVPYFSIPKHIIWLMCADVFLQLINSSFVISLNFYMLDEGFKDYEITSIIGNRYLAVLLCSIPLALLVKGKKMKPFMLTGSILAPLVSVLLIWAIHIHNNELIRLLMTLWGIAFSLLQILVMPYLLLNGNKESETESISLFFAAGNITMIIVGGLNYILPSLTPLFDNRNLLYLFSMIGFVGVYFVLQLPKNEKSGTKVPLSSFHQDYDWALIFKAMIPTFLIAFGAGFTIPFINLFFEKVHQIDARHFSLMSMITFVLVSIGSLIIPAIKRKFGFKFSITFFQSLAIIALFILGATEWWSGTYFGLFLAIFMYIIRQPLMSIAAPLTSELTMNYVGEKNREMISALIAAIWSGSWFASAKIFSILRESDMAYSQIIFITVGLYIIGVAWYYYLIVDFEKRD